jgi:endo-1,4-beta-xylanase
MLEEKTMQGNTATLTVSKEGVTTLSYYTTDNITSQEPEKSIILKLDKTAPTVTIAANPNTIKSSSHKLIDAMINGSATDNLSGISSTVFKVDDEYRLIEPKLSAFNTSIKLDTWKNDNDKDGRIYTITAIITDKAGNETKASTTVVCQ